MLEHPLKLRVMLEASGHMRIDTMMMSVMAMLRQSAVKQMQFEARNCCPFSQLVVAPVGFEGGLAAVASASASIASSVARSINLPPRMTARIDVVL